MDKSWMTITNRWKSVEYKEGVKSFIAFACKNLGSNVEIRCPCVDCVNSKKMKSNVVELHLIRRGIDPSYKTWLHHGEPVLRRLTCVLDDDGHNQTESGGDAGNDDQLHDMLQEIYMCGGLDDDDELPNNGRNDTCTFNKLFDAAQRKVYPGSERTVLSLRESNDATNDVFQQEESTEVAQIVVDEEPITTLLHRTDIECEIIGVEVVLQSHGNDEEDDLHSDEEDALCRDEEDELHSDEDTDLDVL
ncbi:hypothetical protein Dimus_012803 [Dionaea muscipula]